MGHIIMKIRLKGVIGHKKIRYRNRWKSGKWETSIFRLTSNRRIKRGLLTPSLMLVGYVLSEKDRLVRRTWWWGNTLLDPSDSQVGRRRTPSDTQVWDETRLSFPSHTPTVTGVPFSDRKSTPWWLSTTQCPPTGPNRSTDKSTRVS